MEESSDLEIENPLEENDISSRIPFLTEGDIDDDLDEVTKKAVDSIINKKKTNIVHAGTKRQRK